MTSTYYALVIDGVIIAKGSAHEIRKQKKLAKLPRERCFVGVTHSKQVGDKW